MRQVLEEKEKKELEIQESLSQFIEDETIRKQTLSFLIDRGYINISAPMEEEPVMGMIILNSDFRRGGYSRKPGNILLKMSNLIEIAPEIALTISGVVSSSRFLKIMAALQIWNILYAETKIDFSIEHAITIFALWKNCNANQKIDEEEGFIRTNERRNELGLTSLSKSDYTAIINDLITNKSIEITDDIIWLREWVKVKY